MAKGKRKKAEYENYSWEELFLTYGLEEHDIYIILKEHNCSDGKIFQASEYSEVQFKLQKALRNVHEKYKFLKSGKLGKKMKDVELKDLPAFREFIKLIEANSKVCDKLKYLVYKRQNTPVKLLDGYEKIDDMIIEAATQRRDFFCCGKINPNRTIGIITLKGIMEYIIESRKQKGIFSDKETLAEEKQKLFNEFKQIDWKQLISNAREKMLTVISTKEARLEYFLTLCELVGVDEKIENEDITLKNILSLYENDEFSDISASNIEKGILGLDIAKVLEVSMTGTLNELDKYEKTESSKSKDKKKRMAKSLLSLVDLLELEKKFVENQVLCSDSNRKGLSQGIQECEIKLKNRSFYNIISDLIQEEDILSNKDLEKLYDNGLLNMDEILEIAKDWDDKKKTDFAGTIFYSDNKTPDYYKLINKFQCQHVEKLNTQKSKKTGKTKSPADPQDKEVIDYRAKINFLTELFGAVVSTDLKNGYKKMVFDYIYPGTNSKMVIIEPCWNIEKGQLVPASGKAGAICSEDYYDEHKKEFDEVESGTLYGHKGMNDARFKYLQHTLCGGKDDWPNKLIKFKTGERNLGTVYSQEQLKKINELADRVRKKIRVRVSDRGVEFIE